MKKTIILITILLSINTAKAQWNILTTGTNSNFYGISFIHSQKGTAVGYNSTSNTADVIHTTDGGNSWTHPTLPTGLSTLNSIRYKDANEGWIAGDNGYLLHTTNSGQSWDTISRFTREDLKCISVTGSLIMTGSHEGNVFISSDNGLNWDTASTGSVLPINALSYRADSTFWAVGDGGFLAFSADTGRTWTTVNQPYYGFFNGNGIAFFDTSAVAVGDFGFSVHSSGALTSWSMLPTSTNQHLNGITSGNARSVIICGDQGVILRSENGGQGWLNETLPSLNEDLHDISYAGDTTAFICGSNGRILKSVNDISSVQLSSVVSSVEIYPNPFEHELYIQTTFSNETHAVLMLNDLQGKMLLKENCVFTAGQQTILRDFAMIPAGVYILTIATSDSAIHKKIIRN
ncbi:MAG: hypothetical protein Fur0041_20840 [Bacteroidia bacterium]